MLHQDGSWDPFVPKKDGGKLVSFNSLITGFKTIWRLSRNWTKGDFMRESILCNFVSFFVAVVLRSTQRLFKFVTNFKMVFSSGASSVASSSARSAPAAKAESKVETLSVDDDDVIESVQESPSAAVAGSSNKRLEA